jgi:hypothetical protein
METQSRTAAAADAFVTYAEYWDRAVGEILKGPCGRLVSRLDDAIRNESPSMYELGERMARLISTTGRFASVEAIHGDSEGREIHGFRVRLANGTLVANAIGSPSDGITTTSVHFDLPFNEMPAGQPEQRRIPGRQG